MFAFISVKIFNENKREKIKTAKYYSPLLQLMNANS